MPVGCTECGVLVEWLLPSRVVACLGWRLAWLGPIWCCTGYTNMSCGTLKPEALLVSQPEYELGDKGGLIVYASGAGVVLPP